MAGRRIVVVGGGAGGLELVTRLGRRLGRRGKAEITLIDRNPTHIWKPLLHEVATGALDSSIDEISYQSHAQLNGYRFQRGTFEGLDREARQLRLAPVLDDHGEEVLPARSLDYDLLVLALGSVSNDFGTAGSPIIATSSTARPRPRPSATTCSIPSCATATPNGESIRTSRWASSAPAPPA